MRRCASGCRCRGPPATCATRGGTFSRTPEQSFIFAEPHSAVHLIGAFDTAAAMVENQPKVQAAFKTGRGVARGRPGGREADRRGDPLRRVQSDAPRRRDAARHGARSDLSRRGWTPLPRAVWSSPSNHGGEPMISGCAGADVRHGDDDAISAQQHRANARSTNTRALPQERVARGAQPLYLMPSDELVGQASHFLCRGRENFRFRHGFTERAG